MKRLLAMQAERVIVADDHPLFRTAIKEALQASQGDTKFLEASSFETLQELVDDNPDVDLVLLDLHMPGVSGFAGLVYLVAPGVTAPDPLGAVLMATAGVAWGVYSLIGRKSDQPLLATASNFVYSVPLALALGAVFIAGANVSLPGVLLAVASGALASGLGYAIWYAALSGLSAGRAATVQLSVPVIAALGGVVLLSEPITIRLAVASGLTIGGIWTVLAQRSRRAPGWLPTYT